MKHWYRLELTFKHEEARADALSKYLRRRHHQFERSFEPRRFFPPRSPWRNGDCTIVFKLYLSDDALEDVRAWLRTH